MKEKTSQRHRRPSRSAMLSSMKGVIDIAMVSLIYLMLVMCSNHNTGALDDDVLKLQRRSQKSLAVGSNHRDLKA